MDSFTGSIAKQRFKTQISRETERADALYREREALADAMKIKGAQQARKDEGLEKEGVMGLTGASGKIVATGKKLYSKYGDKVKDFFNRQEGDTLIDKIKSGGKKLIGDTKQLAQDTFQNKTGIRLGDNPAIKRAGGPQEVELRELGEAKGFASDMPMSHPDPDIAEFNEMSGTRTRGLLGEKGYQSIRGWGDIKESAPSETAQVRSTSLQEFNPLGKAQDAGRGFIETKEDEGMEGVLKDMKSNFQSKITTQADDLEANRGGFIKSAKAGLQTAEDIGEEGGELLGKTAGKIAGKVGASVGEEIAEEGALTVADAVPIVGEVAMAVGGFLGLAGGEKKEDEGAKMEEQATSQYNTALSNIQNQKFKQPSYAGTFISNPASNQQNQAISQHFTGF